MVVTATAIVSREERVRRIKDIFHSLMWIAARQFSQRLQSFGITHPQFMALAALAAHRQPCTMRDLTNVTFQDPPTMTGIVDRLVKMKLVQRTRSEDDRRVVLVQATPAGIDRVSQIEHQVMSEHLACFADVNDEDLTALEEVMKLIIRMYIADYKSLQDAELNAEIRKLQLFRTDPIYYAKIQNEQ
jgi:DNA-binding MarR family transcriptional regulator